MTKEIEWYKILHGKIAPLGATHYLLETGTFYVIKEYYVRAIFGGKVVLELTGNKAKEWIDLNLPALVELPKEYWRPVSVRELYKNLMDNKSIQVKVFGVKAGTVHSAQINTREASFYFHSDFSAVNVPLDNKGFAILEQTQFEEDIKLKEKTMLERNKEYDVKLTGEEIALIKLLFNKVSSDIVSFPRVRAKLNTLISNCTMSTMHDLTITLRDPEVNTYLDKVFTPPKSQQQIEYENLQKSIEEHKASLKKLEEQANKLKPV